MTFNLPEVREATANTYKCLQERCAWWVAGGERMTIVPTTGYAADGGYARTAETIMENVPGHCAILDIGRVTG